ncbi:MAG: hydrolase [Hyphomicrobiales bacterium]|nr:hydrolase [Hyphomicrobiales bacterium]
MRRRIWDPFLTERDRQVFEASGYGALAGYGERPALVIIDVNYAFCGEKPEPILSAIKAWRTSCGEDAWTALEQIQPLIAAARAKRLPVIYTTGEFRSDGWDAGSWRWKSSRRSEDGERPRNVDGNEIMPSIAPQKSDLVIRKQKPSAFFGTNLTAYLNLLQCDSLIVAGTTTSGCVRATVLDAFNLNYRVAVVEEACFDRSQASHAINLADMHAKYADVVALTNALEFIGALPEGLFRLPGD